MDKFKEIIKNKKITVAVLIVLLAVFVLSGIAFVYIKNSKQPQDTTNVKTKQTELGKYVSQHLSDEKKDITIAVVDSGINDNETSVDERIIGGYNFTSEEDMTDNFYHGKFINNLIVSETDENIKLFPLKVADTDGNIEAENVAQAIDYAVENGADVINISISMNNDNYTAIAESVRRASDSGVYIVFSASNTKKEITDNPFADIKNVYITGAFENDNTLAGYSDYGSGVDVYSYGSFSAFSGTSYATARVSATIATMLENGISDVESVISEYSDTSNDMCFVNLTEYEDGVAKTKSEYDLGYDIYTFDWRDKTEDELINYFSLTDSSIVGGFLKSLSEDELEELKEKAPFINNNVTVQQFSNAVSDNEAEYTEISSEEVNYIDYYINKFEQNNKELSLSGNAGFAVCASSESLFWLASADGEMHAEYKISGLKDVYTADNRGNSNIGQSLEQANSNNIIQSTRQVFKDTSPSMSAPNIKNIKTYISSVQAYHTRWVRQSDGMELENTYHTEFINEINNFPINYGLNINFDNVNVKDGYYVNANSIGIYKIGSNRAEIGWSYNHLYNSNQEYYTNLGYAPGHYLPESISWKGHFMNFKELDFCRLEYGAEGDVGKSIMALRMSDRDSFTASNSTMTLNSEGFYLSGTTWVDEYNPATEIQMSNDPMEFVLPVVQANYIINYNSNGGTGSIPETVIHKYDNFTLSDGTGFTKTGYDFSHWAVIRQSDGKIFCKDGQWHNFNTNPDAYALDSNNWATYEKNAASNMNNAWVNPNYTGDDTFTFVAQWMSKPVESSDVSYRVEHYLQNADGSYTLKEVATNTAKIGATVTGTVKNYGSSLYVSPSAKSINLQKSISSNVIRYYYARTTYKIDLTSDSGIDYTAHYSLTDNKTKDSYRWGESVVINAYAKDKYEFTKWTGVSDITEKRYAFTMPQSTVKRYANTKQTKETVTIQYYLQNADGSYPTSPNAESSILVDIGKSYTCPIKEDTKATAVNFNKKYFNLPTSKTITVKVGSSNNIVKYYYTRTTFKVNLYNDDGISEVRHFSVTDSAVKDSYRWGEWIRINADVKYGYEWSKWSRTGASDITQKKYEFAMPTSDVYRKANTIELMASYKVKYYWQNVDGSYSEKKDLEVNGTARIGSTINAATLVYEQESDSEKLDPTVNKMTQSRYYPTTDKQTMLTQKATITINPDTTKNVVTYYYNRKTYPMKLTYNEGITGITHYSYTDNKTKDSYRWGEKVKLEASVKDGYTFSKWTSNAEHNQDKYTNPYEFTMPVVFVDRIANATPNTIKVTLDNQGGTKADGGLDAYYYMYNTKKTYSNTSEDIYYYNSSTMNENSWITRLKTPTKKGHTFGGYYTEKDGKGTQYVRANGTFTNSLYNTVKSNITLYAKWKKQSYSVTIQHYIMNTSGEYPSSPDSTLTIDNQLYETILNNEDYKESSFLVKNGIEYDKEKTGDTTKVTGNTTIKLYYKRIQHTVTFNVAYNGGTWLDNNKADKKVQIYYGAKVALDTYKAMKSNDFLFIGWNKDKNTEQVLEEVNMGTSDITFYAVYKKTLTATFTDSKGTTTRSVDIYNNKTSGIVRVPKIASYTDWADNEVQACDNENNSIDEKENIVSEYKIVGYNSIKEINKDNATNAEIGVNENTIVLTENKAYYAVYSSTVKLSYVLNGGISNDTTKVVADNVYCNAYNLEEIKGKKLNLAQCIKPEYDENGYIYSYKFVVWAENSIDGGRFSQNSEYILNKNTVMHAIWDEEIQPIEYDISFDGNAGTSVSNIPDTIHIKYDKEITIPEKIPERTAFTFLGWNTRQDGAGTMYQPLDKVKNLTTVRDDTVKMYAQWQKKKIRVVKIASTWYNDTMVRRTENDEDWYNSFGHLTVDEIVAYKDEDCEMIWNIDNQGNITRVK